MRHLEFLPLLLLLSAPAAAQMPPVGRIEIFGHPASLEQVRAIVADLEGKEVSPEVRARESRITELPGVAEGGIEAVCCDGGFTTLYVAVRGDDDPAPALRPAPNGTVRLPATILALGERFEQVLADAVRRGEARDDHSAGHSLMADSAARTVQEAFVAVASADAPLLREVLATSSEAGHRALAAQVIAYAPDKRAILPDLLAAVRDADPAVRNAAIRALGILAEFAGEHPDRGLEVPAEPFVDLLGSVAWTDRNKASFVLMQLTASRDSALLSTLRAKAFDDLLAMARWEDPGHAFPGVVILGRVAGIQEEAIFAALSEGKKATIIDAALHGHRRTEP